MIILLADAQRLFVITKKAVIFNTTTAFRKTRYLQARFISQRGYGFHHSAQHPLAPLRQRDAPQQ